MLEILTYVSPIQLACFRIQCIQVLKVQARVARVIKLYDSRQDMKCDICLYLYEAGTLMKMFRIGLSVVVTILTNARKILNCY